MRRRAVADLGRVKRPPHTGDEHIGQITRRTNDGLVLDTGQAIAAARVCAITPAPLQPAKRDKRDRRLAACAHTLAELAPERRVTRFEFVGVGHLTTADAYLAAQAAARAREHRELAREALYDHHNTRREDRCDTTQDHTRAA